LIYLNQCPAVVISQMKVFVYEYDQLFLQNYSSKYLIYCIFILTILGKIFQSYGTVIQEKLLIDNKNDNIYHLREIRVEILYLSV
jgi:hypothetical protein